MATTRATSSGSSAVPSGAASFAADGDHRTFMEKYRCAAYENKSLLCIGLDPVPDRMPARFRDRVEPERMASFLLEIVDAVAGRFLGGSGEAEVLVDTSRPGRVLMGASRLGRTPGVTGRGELLKMRFRARRFGTGEIFFSESQALDAFLEPVALLAGSTRIVVGSPDVDPEEGLTPVIERPPPEEE